MEAEEEEDEVQEMKRWKSEKSLLWKKKNNLS